MAEQSPFKFRMRAKVTDVISEIEGYVVARDEWLNGCLRYSVQRLGTDKDGRPHENLWIDEQQLMLVDNSMLPMPLDVEETPLIGGDELKPAPMPSDTPPSELFGGRTGGPRDGKPDPYIK